MMVSIHKKVQGMSVSLDDKAEATATSEFSPFSEEEIKAKEEKTKAEKEKTKTERAYIEEKTGLSIEEFLSIKNIEELDKFLGKGNFDELGDFEVKEKNGFKIIKMKDWVGYRKGKKIDRVDSMESLKKNASYIKAMYGTDVADIEEIVKKYFGDEEVCVFRDFDKYPKYLEFGTDKNLNLFKMALIIKLTKLKSRID